MILKTTEKEFTTDIKGITLHMLKFEDENTITLNILQNNKFKKHMELTENDKLYHLFKLEQGESITASNKTVKCIKVEKITEEY